MIWRFAAIYGAAAVVLAGLRGVAGSTGPLSDVVVALQLGVIVAACVQLSSLRREVYQQAPLLGSVVPNNQQPAPRAVDPALQAVLAARARRAEARELAAKDPLMARELHIGRPDLGRSYDDGGLVDLNNAPTAVIAQVCEIDLGAGQKIVDARNRIGGSFSNVDEVFVLAELPSKTWDRVRDRAILID